MNSRTTPDSAGSARGRSASKAGGKAKVGAEAEIQSLLIDEHGAAKLLGLSFWTIREYVMAGLIPVVAPPSPLNHRRKIRRKLIDRRDIEAFIARYKGGGVP